MHIDLPKQQDSEVTMEARRTNDPKIEVRIICEPGQQQSEVTMEARLTDDPEIEVRTKLVGC